MVAAQNIKNIILSNNDFQYSLSQILWVNTLRTNAIDKKNDNIDNTYNVIKNIVELVLTVQSQTVINLITNQTGIYSKILNI